MRKTRVVLVILGSIIFALCSYLEKFYFEELAKLNYILPFILFFVAFIVAALPIFYLFYNSPKEVKERPANFPLLLMLLSLLWLAHNIYIGYFVMNLALKLLVLNGIILVWFILSKGIPRRVLIVSLLCLLLLGGIFAISTQKELTDPKVILDKMALKFESSRGYEAIIHEAISILNKTESHTYQYTFIKPDTLEIRDENGTLLICNKSSSILYNEKKILLKNATLCEHMEDIKIMNILTYFKNANITTSEGFRDYELTTYRNDITIVLVIKKAILLPSTFRILSDNFNYTLTFQDIKLRW